MGLYFMLIAGAGANDTSAIGGAFSFHVNALPSAAGFYDGSALFLLSIFICILYE